MTTTSSTLATAASEEVAPVRARTFAFRESRLAWVALAWLAVTFPLLTFPEMILPDGRLIVVSVAAVSAALAVGLLFAWRALAIAVALLAIVAGLAWARVAGEKEAITHLAGVAVGLLSMAVVAVWCTTARRVTLAVALFLLAGLAALALGLAGTTTQPFKLIALHPSSLPQLKLGLPGLPSNGWVNPNALGGLALMVVPLAVTLLRVPRQDRLPSGLHLLAATTALVGTAAIVIGQARTVWLAAWLTAAVAVWWGVRGSRRRLVSLAIICAVPLVFLLAARGSSAIQPARILEEGRSALGFRGDYVWSQALGQLRSAPWLGIGLNHFRHTYRAPDFLREGTRESAHAHNIWLQTALDVGVTGLLVYLALLTMLLQRAVSLVREPDGLARRLALGSALGIIGVHLFGIADAVSLGARVGLFQWLSAGFILAAAHIAPSAEAHALEQVRPTAKLRQWMGNAE